MRFVTNPICLKVIEHGRMRRIRGFILFKIHKLDRLCLVLSLSGRWLCAQPADLVLRNAELITLDSGDPQGQAPAARGGCRHLLRFPKTTFHDRGGKVMNERNWLVHSVAAQFALDIA